MAAQVAAYAAPVDLGTGPVGVVLSHGFTGSPASMRPWARYLAAHGLRVVAPRLPGHGTTWQAMNRTGWPDWYARVERAYLRLAEECELVVVGGQSMGGALALRLAETYDRIAGVILVNPSLHDPNPALRAVPVLRRLTGSVASRAGDIHKPGVQEGSYDRFPLHALASLTRLWRVVAEDLPLVRQPLQVFRSTQDHVVGPTSLQLLRARVGSSEIEQHALAASYHVASLDYDAETIYAESLDFVRRLAGRAGVPVDAAEASEPA